MNKKINTSDLRKMIAQRSGATEKEVAQFLDALTTEIIEGLKSEDSVRLNGLGTFRRQAVAPRKSVNVTNGETMTIEGYHKLAFSPDAATKELLQNAAGAAPLTETSKHSDVAESTPLQKLSVQADEIVGIIGELNHMDAAPSSAEPAAPPVPEPTNEEPLPIQEESHHEEEEQPYYPPLEPENEEPKEQENQDKNYHPLRDGLITIFIILLLLVIAFFFLKHSLVDFANGIAERIHTTAPDIEVVEEPAPVAEEKPVEALPAETIALEEAVEEIAEEEVPVEEIPVKEPQKAKATVTGRTAAEKGIAHPKTAERTYKTMTIEYIHPNNSLSSLARQYYGETDCWVFIYEANKDKLKSPHSIAAWTEIRIPKIPAEWTDMSNPQTRRMVDEMIQLYD